MTVAEVEERTDRTATVEFEAERSPQGDETGALRTALARAEDRAAWIQDICAALGEHNRLDALLSFIMARIELIMGAELATVFLVEEDGEHLYCRSEIGGETREARLRIGEGLPGWVARTGKSINIRDAYLDPRFDRRLDAAFDVRTRSVLAQPMRDKDGAVSGVVLVLNKRSGHFIVEDEALLSAITNTASIVIENQRLYLTSVDNTMRLQSAKRQLEQQVRRLDTLHEIHRRIGEAAELDEVIAAVAGALTDMVRSHGCAISLIDGAGLVEYAFVRDAQSEALSPSPRTWDTAVRSKVMETGKPMRRSSTPDQGDAARTTGSRVATRARPVTSIAATPLVVERRTIGCVELVNRARDADVDGDRTPEFSADELKLIELVAAEISRSVARSMDNRRREMQGRLSAIGQMLSGVIHDTRTPLTIASGYVQLMARTDEPEKRRRLAALVQSQFAHLNEMTGELLAYARGETALYLRNVHLHALVDDLRAMLLHEFDGSGVDVVVDTEYSGDARLDEGKLKRVVFNLARNAREAMPNGGRFQVRFAREDDALVVRVSDTGGGIPPEIQATAFEAFVSAGRSRGTGLGLAVVKKLVDEHGGHVSFTTEAGHGTEFVVRLPIGLSSAGNLTAPESR